MARTKTETTPTSTAALRAQAVQYFRLGWPDERIAELFHRSADTVRHWRSHPDVKAALAGITEHVIEATKERATDLAGKAWDALEDLLESKDERIKLDAAKTVLDRKGHPAATKSEHTGPEGGPLQHDVRVAIMPIEVAREVAQDGPMRHHASLPAEGETDDE